ncbi:MAG: hypothetical protein IJQ00_06075, partial [Kiritimatiellae bacterium]|nr:hypothetical protein [Kiritimatiellia bacterium]
MANTGSYYPPAIGAGSGNSSCGNILICGGTVTADASDPNDYSYDFGPAIGASASNCGSITIVDGVERIVATKGANALEIIGMGRSDYTSVGKISRLLRFDAEYSNDGNTVTLTPKASFETYTVTWKNDDGTTADTTSVEYGLLPSHAGLTKAGDGYLEYLFAGWTPEIAEVESNTTYTAVFIAVPAVRSTGGAAEWFPDAGERALRSGAIEGNQNTWLQTTLSRPCVLSFKWKTSSEANCDPLVFYVDGVEHSRISGESADWSVVTLSFEDSKNHILRWVYSKDGGVNGKYDCGWIRDFVVTPLDSWAVTRELNYEGAAEIETRYVKKGRQLDVSEFPPLDGLREGYTCYWALAPWSGDALTNAVDISADTTLYARWIKQHGFDEIDTTCQEPWTWLDDGSIRTGKIGDSGNTWATISVTGPCDVSFKWKSSSEGGWDKLHFYVDADHKTDISGAQDDWTTYSASVDSGDHVLKWSYTKDGSGASGEDCGWIKDVVITAPDSAPYTVTWKNADGTTLETDADLAAGAVPVYNSALPTQAATAQYYFDFAGWEPDFELVSSNTTYTAKYTATLRSYDVTWQNEDSTPLGATNIFYGATPTYSGATPVKAATPKFTYTFAGWDPEVAAVTGEATYTAKYDATINEYTITWKNDDGTVIDSADVAYDETPSHAAPTKASTAQYDYEFAGWSPAVASVTGEATYTATFTPILRSYTITWLNEDGTALDTSTVEYGATPSHAAPTKASTAQYDYTFAGWGNVVAVTGEATYQ